MVAEQNFDQWVFGNLRTLSAARARLDALLASKVDEIQRICRINEAQKKKLHLAGEGDIERLMDRVEEKRKKFHTIRFDQNKVGEFYRNSSRSSRRSSKARSTTRRSSGRP